MLAPLDDPLDEFLAARPSRKPGPKLPKQRWTKPSASSPLEFYRDPIVVCKRSLARDLAAPARVLVREVGREVTLLEKSASFVITNGTKQIWKGVLAIGGLSRRAGERRRVRRVRKHAHAVTASTLLADAHGLQAQLDLHAALLTLEQARLLEPNNASILAMASKQWTDHTYLPDMPPEDAVRCNEKAIELAQRAQAADDTFALAFSAESICKGRLATFETRRPRRMLQLAKEAQEAAYCALARNPDDDVAHHLIGRWNLGMASLNWGQRQVIKFVFGDKYRPGTIEKALDCYQHASSSRPDRLIHKVEIARCLASLKRTDEARRLLTECFEMPVEDINARQMLKEASDILVGMGEKVPSDGGRMDSTSVQPALEHIDEPGGERIVLCEVVDDAAGGAIETSGGGAAATRPPSSGDAPSALAA